MDDNGELTLSLPLRRTKLPDGEIEFSEVKEERGKYLDLVKMPSLRVLSILLWVPSPSLFGPSFLPDSSLQIIWFVNSIAYYGNVLFTPTYFGKTLDLDNNPNNVRHPLSLSHPHLTLPHPLQSSIYLFTFVTTLFELPGLLVSALLIDRIGRKKTMVRCHVLHPILKI